MQTSHAMSEQSEEQAAGALSANPKIVASGTSVKAKRGLSRALSRLTKSFTNKRYINNLEIS